MKRILFLLNTLALLSLGVSAQTNGSNSSYSRFGLGTLNDQSQGFNRGMGGAGIGTRIGNQLNMLNPASYSALDSLSFLLDVGMNVSLGHLSSKSTSVNVQNCNIDYVNAGFRMRPGLGISFGFVPYSTIGYNFTTEEYIGLDRVTLQPITSTSVYKGDGGLHQIYLGMGWEAYKELSVGFNFGYLWGTYDHTLKQTGAWNGTTSSDYSGLNSQQNSELRTFKLDFGAQYPLNLKNGDLLTVGATVGIGHQIKSNATLTRFTSTGDSTVIKAKHPFDMPYTYGAGATWIHKTLMVSADATHERWADCKTPVMSNPNGILTYRAEKGQYMNRTKVAVGTQYVPDIYRNYARRIIYRAGANFSTPYLKVNGMDGPREVGLTAGVGLPITNAHNNRSMVNINLQWFHRSSKESSLIKENYFMINVGLSFNERWFMKYKIQ